MSALFEIRDLSVAIGAAAARPVLLGIDLALPPGGRLAVLSDRGAPLAILAQAVLGLLVPPARMTAGVLRLDGRLLDRAPRGGKSGRIAGVLGDPATAFSPVKTLGAQLRETHRAAGLPRREMSADIAACLAALGVADPAALLPRYPAALPTPALRRAALAAALLGRPSVLVLADPFAALPPIEAADLAARVLDRAAEQGTALLLLTQDPGLAVAASEGLAVLHAGRIVETGPTAELVAAPRHPLLAALLTDPLTRRARAPEWPTAGGGIDALPEPETEACSFRERCPNAYAGCFLERPELEPDGLRTLACHRPVGVSA